MHERFPGAMAESVALGGSIRRAFHELGLPAATHQPVGESRGRKCGRGAQMC